MGDMTLRAMVGMLFRIAFEVKLTKCAGRVTRRSLDLRQHVYDSFRP